MAEGFVLHIPVGRLTAFEGRKPGFILFSNQQFELAFLSYLGTYKSTQKILFLPHKSSYYLTSFTIIVSLQCCPQLTQAKNCHPHQNPRLSFLQQRWDAIRFGYGIVEAGIEGEVIRGVLWDALEDARSTIEDSISSLRAPVNRGSLGI